MIPLTYADPGATNVIMKISGQPEIKKHLEDILYIL